jgi:hypothetical protein
LRGLKVDEKGKLKHLLGHWAEHNEDHARTYEEWAAKAEGWKNEELASLLRDLARENQKAADTFRRAKDLI